MGSRAVFGVIVAAMVAVVSGCSSAATRSQARTSPASTALPAPTSFALQCSGPTTVKNFRAGGTTVVTVHLRPGTSPEDILGLARRYTPDTAADLGVNGAGFVDCTASSFFFTIWSSTTARIRDEMVRRLKSDPAVTTVDFGPPG
jgi:hypothetical protein